MLTKIYIKLYTHKDWKFTSFSRKAYVHGWALIDTNWLAVNANYKENFCRDFHQNDYDIDCNQTVILWQRMKKAKIIGHFHSFQANLV